MNSDAILGKLKEEIRKTIKVDSINTNINTTEGSRTNNGDQLIIQDDDDEEPEIKEYTNFIIACLKIMAMQPIFVKNSNWFLDAISLFYIMFVNFISIHIMIFSLLDVVFSWDGNIYDFANNMIMTIIYATNTILLLFFQYYWKDLLILLERLNNTFRFRSAHGLTVLNMTASFRWARLLSTTINGSYIAGAGHWALLPIFSPAVDGIRKLPLKLWYPMDVQKTPYYEIAYFFQFYGQIMTAMVYGTFAVFFLSGCVLISGQFDILCCSLRNIRYTAFLRRGYPISSLIELAGYSLEGENRCTLPEDEYNQYFRGKPKILDPRLEINMQMFLDPSMNDADVAKTDLTEGFSKRRVNADKIIQRRVSFEKDRGVVYINGKKIDAYEEYTAELTKVIEDCVLHHQEILDYCKSFESFCSPISMVKMMQITLLTCCVMYCFSVSFQVIMLEYGTLICCDLFLFCYFGNEVKIRSALVAQVACSGFWHVVDRKNFKNLVFLMLRASKPVNFTGGSFYILNLENMFSVLKASFSYFTVLRKINED